MVFVSEHAQDFYSPLLFQDLIDEPVVEIDSSEYAPKRLPTDFSNDDSHTDRTEVPRSVSLFCRPILKT